MPPFFHIADHGNHFPNESADGNNYATMSLLAKNPTKLAAFRQGERAVLEEIYHTYVDEVAMVVRRGFLYNRGKVVSVPGVRDEQHQLDIVQEAFLRAFSEKARTTYDGQTPYRLYLLRIVKNLMIDQLRRESRRVNPRPDADNNIGNIDDILDKQTNYAPENPAIEAHRHRQQAAVTDFTNQLTEEEQRFYQKRYVLGFSQQKTAETLDMSRRHVRTLEKRLCKKLKAYLESVDLWP